MLIAIQINDNQIFYNMEKSERSFNFEFDVCSRRNGRMAENSVLEISPEITMFEQIRVYWFSIRIIPAVRKPGFEINFMRLKMLQQWWQHPSTLQHNAYFISIEIASPFSFRIIYSVRCEIQLNRAHPTKCASIHPSTDTDRTSKSSQMLPLFLLLFILRPKINFDWNIRSVDFYTQ